MTDFPSPDMDRELLAELQEIMGNDFAMLVESWRRDAQARMEAMEEALRSGDAVQLKQIAHSLKGSSGNLGARDVVAVCLELETLADAQDLSGAETMISRLHAAIRATDGALRAILPG